MVSKNQSVLKKRMDRLNFLWDAFHNELREINPPIDSWVVYDRNPNDEDECLALGFGKINGKWGIYTGAYFRDQDDLEVRLQDVKPIGESRAEMRVKLVKYVPELRKEVESSFEKFIGRTDEAIAEFESQLDLSGYVGEDEDAA